MNRIYDVVVVGAGPAGSTAARFAALGGARTLMVEKHPVVGYPLCCAEAISLTGLASVVEPDPRWISSRIEGARMFGPDGVEAVVHHPDAGYVLERKVFDRALAEQAAFAGAEVRVGVDVVDLIRDRTGRSVGIVANDNSHQAEIQARVIIAADGIESRIAEKAGLSTTLKPRQLHSAYQYLLSDSSIEPETIEFHFGTAVAPGGYIWVFPKGDQLANVGIGVCPAKSPRTKAVTYLDEFVERRFSHCKIIERMTGGIPSYVADMPLYKDNLLIVGDAARLVDSLTGAGIANALISGKLAGETAAQMIRDGIRGEAYEKQFNSLKQKELRFYYQCRQIFLKMTDDDFVSVIRFADDLFGNKSVAAINPFDVVRKILLAHPRLLKLSRHLIF